MSRLVSLLLAGGVLLFVVITLYKNKPSDHDPAACSSHMPQIVALGDSLIYGYGSSKGGGFVSLLEKKAGVKISNFGRNSDTSAQGLARVDQALAEKPDIAIVLLGGNDALQKVPVAETRANLETIIAKFEEQGTKVILLGVLGGLGVDPYQGMFLELSRKYGVLYVPNVLRGLIGDKTFMNDPIHPNDAGYARVADRIYPVLLEACAS